MRHVILITFLFGGCSGNAINNGDGGDSVDMTAPPDLTIPGSTTITISIGPIALDAGQERTVCSPFKLPTTEAIDVVRLDTILAPGSHPLIFYKSVATMERKDPYDCPPLNVSG